MISLNRGPFLCLTQTDSAGAGDNPSNTGGRNYDWGHPLIPTNILSSQVLVGVGWGCPEQRDLNFIGCPMRIQSPENTTITYTSMIWVTPVDDATIYVDYNNNDMAENITNVLRLASVFYMDPFNLDMSGACIWAV